MPTKKESFFSTRGSEQPKPKKPTLFQFIKSLPKDEKFPILSRVVLCWFPGTWDNYNLECEQFRISIGVNHSLYKLLDSNIVKILEESEGALLVSVEDREGTIGFAESNYYGKYRPIGKSGYKFEPTEGAN